MHQTVSYEEEERHQLLISLKHTVEGLLANCSNNVWNTYGGLSRLCTVVDKILSHKLQNQQDNGYWNFLAGLQLLKPTLIPVFSEISHEGNEKLIKREQQWLKNSLQQHILSSQLEILTKDKVHLLKCYQKEAFLCNAEYTKALLICLKAVEENQAALLAKLDPTLVVKKKSEAKQLNLNDVKINDTCEKLSNLNVSNSCYYTRLLHNGRKKKKLIEHSKTMKVGFCDLPDFQYISTQEQTCDLQNKILEHCSCDKNSSCTETNGSETQNTEVFNKEFNYSESGCDSAHVQQDLYATISPSSSLDLHNKLLCCGKLLEDCKFYHNYNCLVRSRSCPELHDCYLPAKVNVKHAQNFKSNNLQQKCSSLPVLYKSLSDGNEYFIENKNIFSRNLQIHKNENETSLKQELLQNKEIKECKLSPDISKSSLPSTKTPKWKAQHTRSKSDVPGLSQHSQKKESIVETSSNSLSLSSSLPNRLEDKNRRQSLLEEGCQVGVPTECFFPRPQEGQSLISFLSSKDFGTCAELDKENAHFCISEALISVIEQIKCNQSLKQAEEESDEEIQKLNQHIRIRRREIQLEKLRVKNLPLLSDGKTDTSTTSASPPSSSPCTASYEESSGTEDDINELELTDTTQSTLTSIQENGLSLSMASLYSDADIQRINSVLPQNTSIEQSAKSTISVDTNGQLSAESVALNLLKKFSEKQLPKASDLQWLVSERDAPQSLLPLPDSWPVSPDIVEEEYSSEKTRLRGNSEWAPPRAQIIFSIHPEPLRKVLIAKQNYRCAGCGTKINQGLISKFRYCEYLGKYFCHCCHNNALAYIPGRILHKWDFSKYHVSKFSSDLLQMMFTDPLFNLADINANLYRKVRQLSVIREYRTQMFFLKDFVQTCRKAKILQEEIIKYPVHLFTDPEVYSIQNLINIKNSELSQQLHHLVGKCINHITQCTLCRAKGFICEICNNGDDIIFPFELSRVVRCQVCWACFHKTCLVPGKCPKCIRIEARKKKKEEENNI
ncbi:run domain Beclin-1-interacting and cysteine-rich domain-containing protein isoform X1 [Centruroides vittatus]|uniref:run domain Beclin-1-interacting and cysteine-rich domain-containing protein isoform X1 n=2 Tax=Centruroides vittatus TaxID=120091 RepID=UPI0035103C5A